MPNPSIPPDARIVATSEQVSCEVEGEAVILNLKNEVYYGLDPVGARIWQLLAQPRSVDELNALLLAEYEVDEQRLRQDVTNLLADLSAHGLIEIAD